jgi:hypothetical protein
MAEYATQSKAGMLTLSLIVVALALLFVTGWLYKRGTIVQAAALLWIAFIPYEVWYRANCTGECNIRADLVLLLPVLLVMSLAATGWVVHRILRKGKAFRAGP